MANEGFVPLPMFVSVTQQLATLTQELLIMNEAFQAVLFGNQIVNIVQFRDACDRIRAGEKMAKIAKEIAQAQDAEDVANILKDLSGPIQ